MFYCDDDRHFFLKKLHFYCSRHGLAVLSYCLMDNHSHLIVIPEKSDSDAHAYAATQYVALNPVRAGLVTRPEEYRWSSARAHLQLESNRIITAPATYLMMANDALRELQRGLVYQTNNEEQWELLRRNIRRNLPVGSPSFISQLESTSGRSLTSVSYTHLTLPTNREV